MPRSFHPEVDRLFSKIDSDTEIKLASDLPLVRIIVYALPDGDPCVLMTSLTNASLAPAKELSDLYWLRWRGCEEGYKLQKIALELENFSGRGFLTLLQDFWSMILIVNIFQTGCLEEEGPWDISSPPIHRINKSVVFGSLREAALLMILGEMSAAEFQKKFQVLARRFRVKVRPGRSYSRENVGKPKRHHVFRRVC